MKHSRFSFGYKLMLIAINLLFILSFQVTAQVTTQTASYNLNSVPIVGTANSAFGYNTFPNTSPFNNYNSAFGAWSIYQAFSSTNNCAFGYESLYAPFTANYNSAFGVRSLYSNWSGSYNSSHGAYSLYQNTNGSYNIGIGSYALYGNITGNFNTALGYTADVGSGNLTNSTAIGYGAIVNSSNTIQLGNSSVTQIYAGTGTNATLITGSLQVTGGSIAAGKVLTSDAFGVATWQTPGGGGGGNWSLTGNAGTVDGTNFIGTTDNIPFNIRVNNLMAGRLDPTLYNTFYGIGAGNNNTTGTSNTAIGYNALYSNADVSRLTALGSNALYSNTEGTNNTATGFNALYSNNKGSYNSANGYDALSSNTTGNYNTAMGFSALHSNTIGEYNTAYGPSALQNNTTGKYNIAMGDFALQSNSTGWSNIAVGSSALYSNMGDANIAVGGTALLLNTTGERNVAVGWGALYNNITGIRNTGLGYGALINSTGSLNTGVGYFADASGNYTNATALGYFAAATGSNMVRIGNSAVTSIGGYANWTNISDERVKKNIHANVPGLAFINKLKPVTYNLDLDAIDKIIQRPDIKTPDGKIKQPSLEELAAKRQKEQIIYTGFLAQDVEKAAKELNYDFSGVDAPKNDKDVYGLRYAEFVVPLVKAVQELSTENNTLKEENKDLLVQLNDLDKRLTALELAIKQDGKTPSSQSEILNNVPRLDQNAPNPFNSNTIIRYNIPLNANNAQIIVTNVSGVALKTISINNKGLGQVVITAGTLTSGNYVYSLIIDGKKIDSKQMVLTK
jgi:hypothetical protein